MHQTTEPQNIGSKHWRELKEEINSSNVRVRDFNTPLLIMDRTSKQNIKDIED